MPLITYFGDGTQTDFPVPSGRVVDRLLVTGSPVTFTQPNANIARAAVAPADGVVVGVEYGQVAVTVTAANQFSKSFVMGARQVATVLVSATAMSATVSLQMSLDGGTVWVDVATYTAATARLFEAASGCLIRIGVATGNFTSATALVCSLERT